MSSLFFAGERQESIFWHPQNYTDLLITTQGDLSDWFRWPGWLFFWMAAEHCSVDYMLLEISLPMRSSQTYCKTSRTKPSNLRISIRGPRGRAGRAPFAHPLSPEKILLLCNGFFFSNAKPQNYPLIRTLGVKTKCIKRLHLPKTAILFPECTRWQAFVSRMMQQHAFRSAAS